MLASRLCKPAIGLMTISCLSGLGLLAQSDDPFARFPAVSPDGTTVAFSLQGDIWTMPVEGGRATRLTVHEAYESYPRWSPDGRQLAFTSNRYGNNDIFVMDATGGMPKRLTFHSANDTVSGWTPSGDILFTTRRTYAQVEREQEIYSVSAGGGTPDRIADFLGYNPSISPDGRFMAFTRGSNGEWRKNYRGPANRQVWLYDLRSKALQQLTDFEGNDIRPIWLDASTILYISEADGTYNLYRQRLNDRGGARGRAEQVTRFAGDGVRYASVGGKGVVVFERQTDLYYLRGNSDPRKVVFQVPSDYRFDPVERRTFSRNASEFQVSPNGKLIAFVVRGEVFLTQNDTQKNRTVRLTDNPYRDQEISWVDDNRLIFSSDRTGNFDLYLLESNEDGEPDLFRALSHKVTALTTAPGDDHSPIVSPDGKKVVFQRDWGTLLVSDITDSGLENETALFDDWSFPSEVSWSPDSRWLAYSRSDLDFNEEVYIHAVDNSQPPVNVTQHPKSDGSPVWSADGSKLGFLSARNNGDVDVWFAWLRKADWEKTQQDWEEADDAPKGQKPEKKEGDEAPAPEPIQIDFERIHERLQQVTSLPGNESDLAISKDGETFFFVSNRSGQQSFEADQDLHSIKWDGTELKPLTKGGARPSNVALGPDGNLYMTRSGGSLSRVVPSSAKVEGLPFSARMTIDHVHEREQIFNEAWRILNRGFYDPNFHGLDWDQMHDKYWSWAQKTSTTQDFHDVFNMMLGELNASHLGLRGPTPEETQRDRTGLLGIEIDPMDDGVRVERVVPGSPADRSASKLAAGDVITSVDGVPARGSTNFYSLLTDRANEVVALSVRNASGEIREVRIRPQTSLSSELYDEWVEDRKELTDKYSGGRLGYIHIQGMNWPSFERFERELVASGSGKDGIVIDVRFNGGGWTTDYLMAVLTVRQHAYTVPRGAASDLAKQHSEFRSHYPYGERLPLAAWTKPSVALCNENSFSNAEIFSHAYKHLGLGTLVGRPTFGAVISTGGAGLIDGSFVRLPYRGWYVLATDKNMENGPAVPDVVVENAPDGRARGEDAQLRRAVEVLLQQIDTGGKVPAGSR